MFKGFNNEVHVFEYMLRAEWLNAAAPAGHGSCLLVFGSRPNRKELTPQWGLGYRRLYTARIASACAGNWSAGIMRQQFTGINQCSCDRLPAGRQRQSLPDHRPDTAPRDNISQPVEIHAVIQITARSLHRAAFQLHGNPSCTTQRVLHSVYTSALLPFMASAAN